MITAELIREELSEVQYYYFRKESIDSTCAIAGKAKILALVAKYNEAICSAPAKLLDLYGCLCLQSMSHKEIACEMNFSVEYVRRLSIELTDFFVRQFNKGGETV